jgi:uncharacterized protein YggT (Ycf19 family)
MATLVQIIDYFLTIYLLCIFVWVLISWLPMVAPQLAWNETVRQIRNFLDSVVLPWVKLFSFIKPVQVGNMLLDLSTIVSIFALILIQKYVVQGLLFSLVGN